MGYATGRRALGSLVEGDTISDTTDQAPVHWFQQQFGYRFVTPTLLDQALRHRSIQPCEEGMPHNERLEFLGDAVLELIISALLFQRFPSAMEGTLSHWRAALVNSHVLSRLGQQAGLGGYLQLGKGEDQSGGRYKDSILGNSFEALIGAVFLDGGYKAARTLVERLFVTQLDQIGLQQRARDYKSLLQEQLQARGQKLPSYRIVEVSGAPHQRHFVVECLIDEMVCGTGQGRSRRAAEQQAAHAALQRDSS
ncbi:MAG: ribonuclease III [Magnetococcales bacterium]|nr:ribonuclease III [Magnetococcales bacterium]